MAEALKGIPPSLKETRQPVRGNVDVYNTQRKEAAQAFSQWLGYFPESKTDQKNYRRGVVLEGDTTPVESTHANASVVVEATVTNTATNAEIEQLAERVEFSESLQVSERIDKATRIAKAVWENRGKIAGKVWEFTKKEGPYALLGIATRGAVVIAGATVGAGLSLAAGAGSILGTGVATYFRDRHLLTAEKNSAKRYFDKYAGRAAKRKDKVLGVNISWLHKYSDVSGFLTDTAIKTGFKTSEYKQHLDLLSEQLALNKLENYNNQISVASADAQNIDRIQLSRTKADIFKDWQVATDAVYRATSKEDRLKAQAVLRDLHTVLMRMHPYFGKELIADDIAEHSKQRNSDMMVDARKTHVVNSFANGVQSIVRHGVTVFGAGFLDGGFGFFQNMNPPNPENVELKPHSGLSYAIISERQYRIADLKSGSSSSSSTPLVEKVSQSQIVHGAPKPKLFSPLIDQESIQTVIQKPRVSQVVEYKKLDVVKNDGIFNVLYREGIDLQAHEGKGSANWFVKNVASQFLENGKIDQTQYDELVALSQKYPQLSSEQLCTLYTKLHPGKSENFSRIFTVYEGKGMVTITDTKTVFQHNRFEAEDYEAFVLKANTATPKVETEDQSLVFDVSLDKKDDPLKPKIKVSFPIRSQVTSGSSASITPAAVPVESHVVVPVKTVDTPTTTVKVSFPVRSTITDTQDIQAPLPVPNKPVEALNPVDVDQVAEPIVKFPVRSDLTRRPVVDTAIIPAVVPTRLEQAPTFTFNPNFILGGIDLRSGLPITFLNQNADIYPKSARFDSLTINKWNYLEIEKFSNAPDPAVGESVFTVIPPTDVKIGPETKGNYFFLVHSGWAQDYAVSEFKEPGRRVVEENFPGGAKLSYIQVEQHIDNYVALRPRQTLPDGTVIELVDVTPITHTDIVRAGNQFDYSKLVSGDENYTFIYCGRAHKDAFKILKGLQDANMAMPPNIVNKLVAIRDNNGSPEEIKQMVLEVTQWFSTKYATTDTVNTFNELNSVLPSDHYWALDVLRDKNSTSDNIDAAAEDIKYWLSENYPEKSLLFDLMYDSMGKDTEWIMAEFPEYYSWTRYAEVWRKVGQ
jgi:hypothetical protein